MTNECSSNECSSNGCGCNCGKIPEHKLCQLTKNHNKFETEEIKKLKNESKFICKCCGRLANEKERLCSPVNLN